MKLTMLRYAACTALAAAVAACGGGGSDLSSMGSSGAMIQSGSVPLIVSDASADDWALVGVRVLSIALVPQGGGDNVTVFTASSDAPYLNLEQLDNLGEILGNVSVPVGTYTGAVVTVGGNPGDVLLDRGGGPGGRLRGCGGIEHPVRRHPDPAHERKWFQSHGADRRQLRFTAGRQLERHAERSTRPGIRSVASGLHRWPPAARCRHHAVGDQLQWPGAPPSDRRHYAAGAASHVWQRDRQWRATAPRSRSPRTTHCCRWHRRRRRWQARSS